MVRITPVQDAITAVEQFTEVAMTDPISAVLVAVGGLLTLVAMGVFGGLSAGAAVSFAVRLFEAPDRPD